jgi:TPR repeat protein
MIAIRLEYHTLSHHMKRRFLFPLLSVLFSSRIAIAAQQNPHPPQTASGSTSQHSKWTEADEKSLLAKSQQGDRESQMWLGNAYEQGWFGNVNFQAALKWFKRAAGQGDPDAQVGLGQMYADGEGVKQSYKRAAQWYRKAAERARDFGGAGQGRNDLGLLYMDGLGVRKNYVQAYMWFRLTNFDINLSSAKALMTAPQVFEAEQMAITWKNNHPGR